VREYGPEIPEDVEFSMLDREVRARLRTLSKDNAWAVGRHLVMAGRLIDEDPELAYEHAQAAVRHGGRVDVVREAAGLAAYRTGRFAEALRELRTVRRLNGSSEHLAVMADCERGLGRPERAIALAASPEADDLDPTTRVELAMVVSGARLDMGDPDAAIAALSGIGSGPVRTLLAARVVQARADALRAAGRAAQADEAESSVPAALLAQVQGTDADEDVVVFDLDEDEDGLEDADESADLDGSDAADLDATDLDATPDDAESDDAESDDDTPGTPTPADTPDAAPAGDEDTEDE
jgi:tetratricopeptide (TPR) repeat protein